MSLSVSVIIPAYNASQTIQDTLESLLSQTSPSWEAIVVDDGSTDGTDRVVQKFVKRDSRIRLVQQAQGGEAAARNAGLPFAHYEWLLFLDADDWIALSYLERMTQKLESSPDLGVVYCRSARVAADGTVIEEKYVPPEGDLFPVLARRAAFPVHACVVRKLLVENVGKFDTSLIKSPDWDLWQRIARTGVRFGYVPEVLAFYRMSPNAASLDADQLLKDGLRVLRRGHSPDPRVPNPHPDHVTGISPDQIRTQEFYLLCWCAGLLLGVNKDARPLLEILQDDQESQLNPDAVAQCLFDSVPLASCQPPSYWEKNVHQILPRIEGFLETLQQTSKTPDLASNTLAMLKQKILKLSPFWEQAFEHYDHSIFKLHQDMEKLQKDLDQVKQRADEREKWRIHWQSEAGAREQERDEWQRVAQERENWRSHWQGVSEQKEKEREDWQKIAEEREKWRTHWQKVTEEREIELARWKEIAEEREEWRKHWQQIGEQMEKEKVDWQKRTETLERKLNNFLNSKWIRLGIKLGLLKKPGDETP